MEYFLNSGIWSSVFAVPDTVVDNYIKLANEASIKVLLYVLKNNGQKIDEKRISDTLNISVSSVQEAFVFWENANVFTKISVKTDEQIKEKKNVMRTVLSEPVKKSVKCDNNMNPTEIAERVEKSEEIKILFLMTEKDYGRPLNHTEQRTLIWIHDYLGLSTDVILMLAAYCISIDKGNIHYIETIAADWAEREINTLERAQQEIKRLAEFNGFNGRIMRIFGMSRKPTSKQQEFIDSWRDKGYSFELIEYAYEKTIERIDKLNFPYINKILENWHQNGFFTKEQIDMGQKQKKESDNKEYSFNMDDIKSLSNNFGE